MENYTELVGQFRTEDNLAEAISQLTTSGWNWAELSLLAQHNVLVPEHLDKGTGELADDERAERQAPLSDDDVRQSRTIATGMAAIAAAFIASGATIMTGGGTLAAIVGAAVAGGGAGGVVEAIGRRIGSQRARFLREQIEGGGILLWVKIEGAKEERKARTILERCGATNIHAHDMERSDTTG